MLDSVAALTFSSLLFINGNDNSWQLKHPPKLLYLSEDWLLNVVSYFQTHPLYRTLWNWGEELPKPFFCSPCWLLTDPVWLLLLVITQADIIPAVAVVLWHSLNLGCSFPTLLGPPQCKARRLSSDTPALATVTPCQELVSSSTFYYLCILPLSSHPEAWWLLLDIATSVTPLSSLLTSCYLVTFMPI